MSRPLPARLAVAVVFAAVLAGCGGDPQSPTCPELPLYDVRDEAARNDPDVQAALEDAEEAGCVTLLGDPSLE